MRDIITQKCVIISHIFVKMNQNFFFIIPSFICQKVKNFKLCLMVLSD